jgi:hypothetical protein
LQARIFKIGLLIKKEGSLKPPLCTAHTGASVSIDAESIAYVKLIHFSREFSVCLKFKCVGGNGPRDLLMAWILAETVRTVDCVVHVCMYNK